MELPPIWGSCLTSSQVLNYSKDFIYVMFKYEYWGLGSFNAKFNMALEEFLLKRAEGGIAQFRFWDFSKDSVVLGYAQATDALKQRDNSLDVVRRITGGSHIQTGK